MNLYKYKSYDEYLKFQVEANKRKINRVWAQKCDIKMLSEYISKTVKNISFGICHGTRNGREQQWFKEYLGVNVIGTELSPTATGFSNTIKWDFHKTKPNWINNVDFIYSNAFDHSYDPPVCLDAWMSCVKPGGVCIIEWSRESKDSEKVDCFGASRREYKELFLQKYQIRNTLKSCGKSVRGKPAIFFVVGHKW